MDRACKWHLLCLHGELWHFSSPLRTAAMPQAMPGWQVMPGSQVMPLWQHAPGATVPLECPGARREAARAEGQCPCSHLREPLRSWLCRGCGPGSVMLCAKQQLFGVRPSNGSSLPCNSAHGSLSRFRTNSGLLAVQRCCQLEPAEPRGEQCGSWRSWGSASVLSWHCQQGWLCPRSGTALIIPWHGPVLALLLGAGSAHTHLLAPTSSPASSCPSLTLWKVIFWVLSPLLPLQPPGMSFGGMETTPQRQLLWMSL